jgi:hypothetical protein
MGSTLSILVYRASIYQDITMSFKLYNHATKTHNPYLPVLMSFHLKYKIYGSHKKIPKSRK